tara:strand:- start:36 stop:1169 length:1134 start_codon:yes stop_codon:yes gene_type:complete
MAFRYKSIKNDSFVGHNDNASSFMNPMKTIPRLPHLNQLSCDSLSFNQTNNMGTCDGADPATCGTTTDANGNACYYDRDLQKCTASQKICNQICNTLKYNDTENGTCGSNGRDQNRCNNTTDYKGNICYFKDNCATSSLKCDRLVTHTTTIHSGQNFPGNDITNTTANTREECDIKSREHSDATGFVYRRSDKKCWTKRGAFLTPGFKNDSNFDTGVFLKWHKYYDNIDFPGNDVKSFSVNNIKECDDAAVNTKNVVGYAMTKNKDANNKYTCWLKSKLDDGATNTNNNRITYRLSNDDPFTYKLRKHKKSVPGVDYSGNDIAHYTNIKNVQDCEQRAASIKNSVGFVINTHNPNECWVKSSFANPTSSDKRDTYMF